MLTLFRKGMCGHTLAAATVTDNIHVQDTKTVGKNCATWPKSLGFYGVSYIRTSRYPPWQHCS